MTLRISLDVEEALSLKALIMSPEQSANTPAFLKCLGASLLRSIFCPSLKFQQNVNAKAHACFLF